jgi:N-methylhydantoinase A
VNAPLRDSAIRLSADVGGTFTDVAAFDEKTGALRLGKTLTTPERLVTGIENGVGKAGSRFQAAKLFLHGTTVAINTILERTGARCSPRSASAISTRSAASTGRSPTTCSSRSTHR